jgi:hypothetical protein
MATGLVKQIGLGAENRFLELSPPRRSRGQKMGRCIARVNPQVVHDKGMGAREVSALKGLLNVDMQAIGAALAHGGVIAIR